MSLTPEDIAKINRLGHQVKGISGPGVFSDGQATRIHMPQMARPPQVVVPPLVWLKITGAAGGTGFYKSRIQVPNGTKLQIDQTAALNLANYLKDLWDGSDDSYFYNVAETNGAGGSPLKTDGSVYLQARPSPWPSTDGKPIFETLAGLGGGGIIVHITAAASGGGKYTGTIETGTANSSASGNVSMPEGMTTGQNCLIIDVEETGQSGHRIVTDGTAYAIGDQVGMSTDTPSIPVVMIRGALGDLTSPKNLIGGSVLGSPDTQTWDWGTDGQALTLTVLTSFGWDATANEFWWGSRVAKFDARGILRNVSAETQHTQGTTPCS